jgi:hypothetical protein
MTSVLELRFDGGVVIQTRDKVKVEPNKPSTGHRGQFRRSFERRRTCS